jgi:uncharacterized protein YxeA
MKKILIIIGIILVVIVGGIFAMNKQQVVFSKLNPLNLLGIISASGTEQDYVSKTAYEFNYNSTSKIYSQDLANIRTEIKDTGSVEMSKWNKEVFLIIEKPNVYPALSLSSASSLDNKLISKTSDNVDLNYYFKEIDNSDGLEYEVVLKEKPLTNIISFNINSENLNFYYQPPLNIEYNNASCTETDCQGMHRPIDVVGSYAVYHSSKRDNEYMTGKAFHIYRPLVTDKNNNSIWG